MDNPKKVDNYEVEFATPELKRLFRETSRAQIRLEDTQEPDETGLIITSPFTDFMWFWDRFEAAANPVSGDSESRAAAREDLKQLLPLIRQSELEPFFKARDAAYARGVIPYAYLWTMFPPGTKVFAKTFMDDIQMLEAHSCSLPDSNDGAYTSRIFLVNCLGFDWDGTKFDTYRYSFRIAQQKNEKEITITSLSVYPTTYFRTSDGERNDAQLQQSLRKRGQRFWSLCGVDKGVFQYQYSGAVHGQISAAARMARIRFRGREDDDRSSIISGAEDSSLSTAGKKEYEGPIIVDAYSFLRAQEESLLDEPPLGNIPTSLIPENDCQWFVVTTAP